MKRHNKQHDARGSSFKRMAVEHRAYARSHRTVAKDKTVTPELRSLHRSLAIWHAENAAILDAEAKRIRAMR